MSDESTMEGDIEEFAQRISKLISEYDPIIVYYRLIHIIAFTSSHIEKEEIHVLKDIVKEIRQQKRERDLS